MLQVYDRVVPTGGKTTLLFVTIALALALLAMSGLEMVRSRLLVGPASGSTPCSRRASSSR